jgi:hypothetical protein
VSVVYVYGVDRCGNLRSSYFVFFIGSFLAKMEEAKRQ